MRILLAFISCLMVWGAALATTMPSVLTHYGPITINNAQHLTIIANAVDDLPDEPTHVTPHEPGACAVNDHDGAGSCWQRWLAVLATWWRITFHAIPY